MLKSILDIIGVYIIGIILAVVISCFAGYFFEPTFPAPILVTGDQTFVGTAAQLSTGVALSIPYSEVITVTALIPFQAIPPIAITDGADLGVVTTTIRLTNPEIEKRAYVGAIMQVDDAQRTLTVGVTAPPFWPVFTVLAGLIVAYGASAWVSYIRQGLLLDIQARETMVAVLVRDAARGDINGDDKPEFSIIPEAVEVIGIEVNPPLGSVRERIKKLDYSGANAQIETLQGFITEYEAFIAQVRELFELHTSAKSYFPNPLKPSIVRDAEDLTNAPNEPKSITRANIKSKTTKVASFVEAYPALISIQRNLEYADTLIAELDKLSKDAQQSAALELVKKDLEQSRKAVYESLDKGQLDAANSSLDTIIDTLKKLFPTLSTGFSQAQAQKQPAQPSSTSKPGNISWPPPISEMLKEIRWQRPAVLFVDLMLLLFSMVIAATSAMTVLYIGKPFGTPYDYLTAFLWGFGVDQTLKGIGAVLSALGVSIPLGALSGPSK